MGFFYYTCLIYLKMKDLLWMMVSLTVATVGDWNDTFLPSLWPHVAFQDLWILQCMSRAYMHKIQFSIQIIPPTHLPQNSFHVTFACMFWMLCLCALFKYYNYLWACRCLAACTGVPNSLGSTVLLPITHIQPLTQKLLLFNVGSVNYPSSLIRDLITDEHADLAYMTETCLSKEGGVL